MSRVAFLFMMPENAKKSYVTQPIPMDRISPKDENICFDGYIGAWILRIYQRYIGECFYMNMDISEIKLL